MKQLTKKQAMKLYDTKFWESMTDREITEFQVYNHRLCMPFDIFHKAVEKTLGRPVYTHEFGSAGIKGIKKELKGKKNSPTFEEIINLIPEKKRILVML